MVSKKVKSSNEQKMEDIFHKAQLSRQVHQQCIEEMTHLYEKMSFLDFVKKFLLLLRAPLHIFDKSTAVDVCLEFVAKFAQSLPSEEDDAMLTSEASETEAETNRFVKTLFQFILAALPCQTKAVRLRGCQLMSKMFQFMGEDAQIDDQLYGLLVPAALERAKDKVARVRFHAVNALTRLQDPSDSECPIICAFMFLMTYDPSPEVRNAVLSQIALTKTTLPLVLERCRDVSEANRKNAYALVAEKLSLKVLNLTQRTQIIEGGLNDPSEAVKSVMEKKVIPTWLKNCNGKITDFLYRLDLTANESVGERVLKALFKHKEPEELVKEFDLLTPSRVIDELTCENVFYWKGLIAHIRDSSGDDANKAAEIDELIDQLLPPLYEFVDYFNSYIKSHQPLTDQQNLEENLTRLFISNQLLKIVKLMDMSDGAGRKHLLETAQSLIADPKTAYGLIEPLVAIFCGLQKKEIVEATSWIAETIADMRQPMTEGLDAVHIDEAQTQGEKKDPETLTRCLKIVCATLQQVEVTSLTSSLRSLLESLVYSRILPSVQHSDPMVRNFGFTCLGLCSSVDKTVAGNNMILFIQTLGVDVYEVKITALKAIFDILLVYGFKLLESVVATEDEAQNQNNPAEDMINVFFDLLDGKAPEMHAIIAEGLAKLLLHQIVYAPKILSRLILLWFNPVSKDNPKLRHCIGTFLPLFAFENRINQEALEEAFLPTLRILFKAPVHNPLTKVDPNSVASFMVELTSRRHLTERAIGREEPGVHGSLAIKICNEMLLDVDADGLELRTLAKTLTLLDYQSVDKSLLKDLNLLLERSIEEVRDKLTVKYLSKAKEMVEPFVPEETDTEDVGDPEEIKDVTVPLQQKCAAIGSQIGETSMTAPSKAASIFGMPKKQRNLLKSSDTTMLFTPIPEVPKSNPFAAMGLRTPSSDTRSVHGPESPVSSIARNSAAGLRTSLSYENATETPNPTKEINADDSEGEGSNYCFSEFNMKEELIEWSQAVSFVSGMSCFSSHSTDLSTQSYSSFDSLPSLLSQSTAKSEAEKDEKDVRKYSLLVSEGLISVMSTATELGYREKLLETMQLDSNLNSTQFQNSVEAKLRSYITSTRKPSKVSMIRKIKSLPVINSAEIESWRQFFESLKVGRSQLASISEIKCCMVETSAEIVAPPPTPPECRRSYERFENDRKRSQNEEQTDNISVKRLKPEE